MKVEILKDDRYKDFQATPDGRRAQFLHAGDVVDFPEEYAYTVIKAGLGQAVKEVEAPVQPPVEDDTPILVDDPGEHTVSEVKGWELSPQQWQQVLELEKEGKARSSLVGWIEDKLAEE